MKGRPDWLGAERVERSAEIRVSAPPEKVFPLLCPVREYDWIPGWSCGMIYSESGRAELGAMFETRMMPFGRELWTCVLYEPPRRIGYLFTHGSRIAVQLELELEARDGGTALRWTNRYTVAGRLRKRLVLGRYGEESFRAMMEVRERQLAEYFARAEDKGRRRPG
jgi:hypothetical protein